MEGEIGFQDQTTMTPVAPAGGAPAFDSGELGEGIQPTRWQQFFETIKQVSMDSPIGIPGFGVGEGAWLRLGLQKSLERDFDRAGMSKLSPEEANEKYPGMPVPFKEPVYPVIAEMMYSDQQKRNKIQEWVNRGPEMGVGMQFAAGAASALDPLNLALNIATGGISKAAGVAPTLRNIFLENLGTNVATEIPTYIQNKRERQNIEPTDLMGNVLASSLLGTAIGKVIHVAGESLARTSPRLKEKNIKLAIAQHERGHEVDMTPGVKTAEFRAAGVAPDGDPNVYVFTELNHPSQSVFYTASDADTSSPITFGKDYGDGAYAVDNGLAANHLAADPDSPFTGRMSQIEIPEDAKFLDLRASVDEVEAKSFVATIEEKLETKLELPDGASLSDVIEEIKAKIGEAELPETALNDVAAIAKEQGFDGYRFVIEHGPDSKQNGVMIFDQNRFNVVEEFTPNKEIAPKMPEITFEKGKSPLADPDLDAHIEELKSRQPLDPTQLDPVIAEQEAVANNLLKELAGEDPALRAELEALRAERAVDAQESDLVKKYAECLIRGIA